MAHHYCSSYEWINDSVKYAQCAKNLVSGSGSLSRSDRKWRNGSGAWGRRPRSKEHDHRNRYEHAANISAHTPLTCSDTDSHVLDLYHKNSSIVTVKPSNLAVHKLSDFAPKFSLVPLMFMFCCALYCTTYRFFMV